MPHYSETFVSALIVKSIFLRQYLEQCSHFIVYIQVPVFRHLHFPKFNNICYFSDHLTNLSRSFCKCCLSPSLLTFLKMFVIGKFQHVASYIIVQVIILRIINVLILILVVPHSKMISSLILPIYYNTLSVCQPFFYPVNNAFTDTMGF